MAFSRSRDFRLLLAGQITSQLGTQLSAAAIPLLAVLTLHADSLEVGVINAASTIAFAVIGLPAGAWTDRWSRRPVLVVADTVRALALATIPLAWALGGLSIVQLVAVMLAVGFARVFFDLGYQTFLPAVVGSDGVLAGNSAMETVRAAGQFVGPGAAGWLVGFLGAAPLIGLQALTFGVSAVLLLAIRARDEHAPRVGCGSVRREIGAGLRFVVGNRILRATAFTSAASNFAFAVASAVTVIFMSRDLGLRAGFIGDVLAVGALAAMAGAALTPRLSERIGSARVIWFPLIATGPFGGLVVLARPGWWSILIVVGTAAGEFGQIIYAITNVSLRQRACPQALLGRVNATMRFFIMALFPAGAILGGVLGDAMGARWTLLASFAVLTVAPAPTCLALWRFRTVEDIPSWRPPTES